MFGFRICEPSKFTWKFTQWSSMCSVQIECPIILFPTTEWLIALPIDVLHTLIIWRCPTGLPLYGNTLSKLVFKERKELISPVARVAASNKTICYQWQVRSQRTYLMKEKLPIWLSLNVAKLWIFITQADFPFCRKSNNSANKSLWSKR